MRKLRSNRYWVMLPVMVWIFAQIQMTLAVPQAYGQGSNSAPFPETIVLCSTHGVIEVAASDLSRGDEQPAERSPHATCGWCHICSAIDLPVRIGMPSRDARPEWVTRVDLLRPLEPRGVRILGFRSRAPPV